MSSSIVSDCVVRFNSGSMLSVGDVAERFGVHPNTIRSHADRNKLRCFRINGGHRRFAEDDVLAWLGIANEDEGTDTAPSAETPLALVCRVSTPKQARLSGQNATGSSLDHQIDRVEAFATEKYGLDAVRSAKRFYGTGSGLNFERPELLRLVRDILAGEFRGGFVIAYDQTRLVRFGIKLIEHICALGECQIVYVMKDGVDEETMQETLAQDLLGVITHYSNKYSGLKAAKITTIPVDPEDLARIWSLHCEGYGHKVIMEILKEEGRTDPKNNQPYTRWVVERSIKQNADMLEETLGRGPTRFETFASIHIVRDESSTLTYGEVEAAYQRWELEQEKLPVTNPVIKNGMLRIGVEQRITKKGGRSRKLYVGVKLV